MPLYFDKNSIPIKNLSSVNYNDLKDIPTINGILLVGDLTLSDLGINNSDKVCDCTNNVSKEELDQAINSLNIPKKLSELEIDIELLTEIPAYYVTQEQLSHVLTGHYVSKTDYDKNNETLLNRITELENRIVALENKQ